jgi:hypothetical protein
MAQVGKRRVLVRNTVLADGQANLGRCGKGHETRDKPQAQRHRGTEKRLPDNRNQGRKCGTLAAKGHKERKEPIPAKEVGTAKPVMGSDTKRANCLTTDQTR